MTRSRRLAGVALSGAVALACAVLPAPAQAAPAADTPVGTVKLSVDKPTRIGYVWSGPSGFQYAVGTSSVTHWVDYPGVVPPAHAGPDDLATGTDVVSTRSGLLVPQRHRSTGVTATVTIPDGQTYKAVSGWSVLTQDTAGALHVLRAADGDTAATDLTVTGLPAGAQPTAYVTGGSVRRLAVVYTLDGATSAGFVDLADGTFRTSLTGTDSNPTVRFNDRWLVAGHNQVSIVSSGVPASPLAQMEAQTDAVAGPTTANPWAPVWQLNKPSTWTLTLSNSAGTVVRTLTGSSTGAAVRASWNGLWDNGNRIVGTYTWKLTAQPRDGQGPDLALTGTTSVN